MSKRLGSAILMLLCGAALSVPARAQGPNVNDNGVVNGASFGSMPAPGSIVSIFGTNLASAVSVASSIPLSTSLGGVSVTFNGNVPAPLFFVGPLQVNAQLPGGLTGSTATVVVTTGAGSSAPKTIQIGSFSPSIFTVNQAGTGQGWVLFANTADVAAVPATILNTNSHPAKAGDVLTIYANGLGPVMPPVADGNNTLDALRNTASRPTLIVGGVTVPDADMLFSGLAPQFVALYQINFVVPSGVTPGNAVPVQIRIGNVTSTDQVTIAVQ
jgi:uncharacterized protein (TIGR03437 family)